MSFTEGCVMISVSTPQPGVTEVHTRSTRAGEVAKAIVGQPCGSPLPETLIRSLYALCPQAHLAAWRCALAYAKEDEPVAYPRKIVYEMLGEHLRFLAFDAHNTVGMRPDAQVRRLGALRAQLDLELERKDPDYDALDETIEHLIEYFVTGCPMDKFSALKSLPDFEAWIKSGASCASRLFAQLWENVPCRKHTSVASLPVAPSVREAELWFEAGLSMSSPKIKGQNRQTGAESRCFNHPLLKEISEQYGCGVRANFAARLIDLFHFWQTRKNPQGVIEAGSPDAGVGLALVQCARGLLTVRVSICNGIVSDVRVIAPTEWNFAPGGVAQQALSSIAFESETQFKGDASWILAALDPCVPYQIRCEADAR